MIHKVNVALVTKKDICFFDFAIFGRLKASFNKGDGKWNRTRLI